MPFSGKAEICPIQSKDIGQYHKIAVPFIKSALEQTDGETSLRQILSDLANQKRQLWLIKADGEFIGGLVTQIYKTETGKKIGEITMAGGRDYHLWDHFSDVVGFWFKDMGCSIVRVIGRAGWERHLKDKGFSKRYTILQKGI